MFISLHVGFPPWTWRPTLTPKTAKSLLVFLVSPSHSPQPLVFSSRTQKGRWIVASCGPEETSGSEAGSQ